MISLREILSVSPRKSGGSRVRLKYTLTDNRAFIIGPMSVSDLAEANSKLAEMEPKVLSRIKEADAEESIEKGIEVAFGEASLNNVRVAWLRQAFKEDNHVSAYSKMKRIMPKLIKMNKTDSDYANLLGVTLKEFTKLKLYWAFLDTNKATITAYSKLQGKKR